MLLNFLKSKIHRGVVTDANLAYTGSISIDPELCKAADLSPYEQVDVYNCNNGARLTTYVILGKAGEICLNGAAARHAEIGDVVIIASYCQIEKPSAETHKPIEIYVNHDNSIKIAA